MTNNIFKTKKYITNNLFIQKALELKLSLEEFLMLTYFDNCSDNYLDINEVAQNLSLKKEEAYQVFNNLLNKKLLAIETIKDLEGRLIEKVSLDNFYNLLTMEADTKQKLQIKSDIFSLFESDFFGRPINNMEYEIINAWLEKGYSEELITCALKEAIYNGASNLRYIDKILYEWHKKGLKTKEDVDQNLKEHQKNKEENRKELFDYNWLDDEE